MFGDTTNMTVTLSHDEWNDIEERLAWLEALEAAGVDNWSGYDDAREIYNGEYGVDH